MSGRLLLLNGAPSTGKTTLARALQERSPVPLWHRSLDDFIGGWRVRPAGIWERLVRGYLGALRAMLDNDIDVVAEAVILPNLTELYRATFEGVPVLLVGVRCPLDIAQCREAERTDRARIELDVPEWTTVHEHDYDLEVDTSTRASTDEGVDRVLARFLEL